MTPNRKTLRFGSQTITLNYDQASRHLIEPLFLDISTQQSPCENEIFIAHDSDKQHYQLTHKTLSRSALSLANLSADLMALVIHELIKDNHDALALHTAMISNATQTILLPAQSGAGKSTLTTWLINNGYRYHTDELLLLDNDSERAFTRPLKYRQHGFKPILQLLELSFDDLKSQYPELISDFTMMIPHRIIQPDYQTDHPPIGTIIFPEFNHAHKPQLSAISRADAIFKLMSVNVIARNQKHFGIEHLKRLTQNTQSYTLQYSDFDQLNTLLLPIL